MAPRTDPKARLNYLLDPLPATSTTEQLQQPSLTPHNAFSSARLAALSLSDAPPQRPVHTAPPMYPRLPTLQGLPAPSRAHSAETPLSLQQQQQRQLITHRSDSGFSDVTPPTRSADSIPPSHSSISTVLTPFQPSLPTASSLQPQPNLQPHPPQFASIHHLPPRPKTDAEIRAEKREQRRMKNRISAARSRQKKSESFDSLQRQLEESRRIIENLTQQIGGASNPAGRGVVVAVPQDLRAVLNSAFISADELMDLLRRYIRNDPGLKVLYGNTGPG